MLKKTIVSIVWILWVLAAPAGVMGSIIDCPAIQILEIPHSGSYWPGSYQLNDRGQAVGSAYTAPGQQQGFLWSQELGMTPLGTLGGDHSTTVEINESGQVTGFSSNSGGQERAYLWQSGSFKDLGSLAGKLGQSWGTALNQKGQVVGYSETGIEGQGYHGFLWDKKSGLTDLGTLGGYGSFARAINEKGQVVGESVNRKGQWQGFLWEKGDMTELEGLGGNRSGATDVNSRGQIVGYSRLTDGSDYKNSHAVLWDKKGSVFDLGVLEGTAQSKALSINNSGDIVGFSTYANGESVASLWDSKYGLFNLNELLQLDSCWSRLEQACYINEQGHIIGIGYLDKLLDPTLSAHTFIIVPEPPVSVLLWLASAVMIGHLRRFRRPLSVGGSVTVGCPGHS